MGVRQRFLLVGFCLPLLSLDGPVWSEEPIAKRLKGFAAPEEQPVTATLIAEHVSVQLGGKTRVGVHFDIEEGWHLYAKNPGDAGLPTRIAWSALSGVSFGPLQWPPPQKFLDPGEIRTFGYSGTVMLSSPLVLAATAKLKDRIPIHADVQWVACKELCVPGSAVLELTLPVSPDQPVLSTHAELFEQGDSADH